MALIWQRVTPIVSHPLTRPDDLGVTHEHSGQIDPHKPHHHSRFSRRSALRAAAGRRQGLCGMRVRFPPFPRLSARPYGDGSGRWVPDPPCALPPCPARWGHPLADPVHQVSRGVHRPPPLCLALSPEATGGGPRRPVGHPWGAQFGAVCDPLAYLPHGPLSPALRLCSAQGRDGTHPVWTAAAALVQRR